MSRRYSAGEAYAILEQYTREALATEATTLPRATKVAEARLNRAARRALGARSDGRFAPIAAGMTVIRTRNTW